MEKQFVIDTEDSQHEATMNFVATYDIASAHPDPHTTVLREAPNHGWSAIISCNDGVARRHLPNTTLQGSFETAADATSAFRQLISASQSKLGRRIEVERLAIFVWTGGSIFDLHEF